MGEAMARAHSHWQAHFMAGATPSRAVPPTPAFTVAISRQAGTWSSRISGPLGERLGWPVYDRGLLQRIADDLGVKATLLESVDERRMNWLQGFLDTFAAQPAVTPGAYVYQLVKMLLSLAAHGDCIIVGRGAAQVLPPETTLRVRLVAPLPDRIATVRQRFGVTREEATHRVEAADRDRDRFIRDNFHTDPADAARFDVVLNVARFSADDCVDLIEQSLKRRRSHAGAPKEAAPSASAAGRA
jgi:cytidylate kinase